MALFTARFGVGPLVRILLVEDDLNDQTLFCMAARKSCLNLHIRSARDGRHAMEHLEGLADGAGAGEEPLPHVVVLDLDLPVVNGLEFLGWCKSSERFRQLPVVMVSGCPLGLWEPEARRLGADRCFEKPLRLGELIQRVHEVWELARVRRALGNLREPPLVAGKAVGVTHREQVPYSE